MSKPGTRRFIGPLKPAQQRRRLRSQSRFQRLADIADARCLSMREAFKNYTILTDHHSNYPFA